MVVLKPGKLDDSLDAYDIEVAKKTGADSLIGRAFVYLRKVERAHAQADTAANTQRLFGCIDQICEYRLSFDLASTIGAYCGVTSPAPVPASSPGSGRLSNTSSMRPNAFASSDSRNLSRSIAFSISSID